MPGADRVLLYVGAPKTGTTSAQAFLRDNRDALAKQGFYIPMAGRGGTGQHIELPTIVNTQRQRNGLDRHAGVEHHDINALKSKFLYELDKELSAVPAFHTILFFSEHMFSSNVPELDAYRELFSKYAPDLDCLMYLRRQDRWLASLTLQARKTGARSDLALKAGSARRYGESIRAWDSRSDHCHIRRLDDQFLYRASLLEDICHVLGIDTSGLSMVETRANLSVLQEQLELVDALNQRISSLPFRDQILYRTPFIPLCTDTLGGSRIEFGRDTAKLAFESFARINKWLHDTRDPLGSEFYFDADFSDYGDKPDNDRRYTSEQLMRLASEISKLGAASGCPAPPQAPDRRFRAGLVDHVISSYVTLRASEIERRGQNRRGERSESPPRMNVAVLERRGGPGNKSQ